MRLAVSVLLSVSLLAWACPASANKAGDSACLPPQTVALPLPASSAVQPVDENRSGQTGESFTASESSAAETVVECRPQAVDTVRAGDKGLKITQNSAKVATNFDSPAPPEGLGKKISVRAYAYCINGRTASGTKTKMGTVAVDRSLIPLGSKIYIPGYGWGTALDTGGHMRGKVIDIWYPSYGKCMQWGVRNVTITVLPK